MMNNLELRLQSAPWNAAVEVLIHDRTTGAVATNLEMKRLTDEEKAVWRAPLITISNQAAQTMMDDLWRCGLRPSEGSGSAGALAATQKHLEDMRKIAHSMLDRALPSVENVSAARR